MNIDLNCEFVAPKSISDVLDDLSAIDDVSQKLSKLKFLLYGLEEEARKIDAIGRELPLSIRLLSDAIEIVRGKAVKLKGKEKVPAMEEFLPLKGNNYDGDERAKTSNDKSEEKNRMNSVVVLNNPVSYDYSNPRKPGNQLFFNKYGDVDEGIKLSVLCKRKGVAAMKVEEEEEVKKDALPVNGLTLSPPVAVVDKTTSNNYHCLKMNNKQEQRKQRRCWSPELHQRFVNALDKLGGAQAATPKQIREIMNVDGLTNDEVKSHLQKYRIHVRRLTASPVTSSSTWPRPYRVVTKVIMSAQSSSPESPLLLGRIPAATREISMTVSGVNVVEESEEEESEGFDGHTAPEI